MVNQALEILSGMCSKSKLHLYSQSFSNTMDIFQVVLCQITE